jgi:hypothetical protein
MTRTIAVASVAALMGGLLAVLVMLAIRPVSHPVSHCTTPTAALGQFITVHQDGSATFGTNGSASHVLICTESGWQHV